MFSRRFRNTGEAEGGGGEGGGGERGVERAGEGGPRRGAGTRKEKFCLAPCSKCSSDRIDPLGCVFSFFLTA